MGTEKVVKWDKKQRLSDGLLYKVRREGKGGKEHLYFMTCGIFLRFMKIKFPKMLRSFILF